MRNIILSSKEIEAIKHLRNSLIHNGRLPSIRSLMKLMKYKSPRSISLIIDQLLQKGILLKKDDGKYQLIEPFIDNKETAQTINIPLIGSITCGLPILAEENIEAYIPVSIKLAKPPNRYFILKAMGDSMNKKGIDNGDYVLIKQQQTANNGQDVVALIDESATIKEYHGTSNAIILKPVSTNTKHKPIILTTDFIIQGIVVATLPKLL